jgi:hypothetical protein
MKNTTKEYLTNNSKLQINHQDCLKDCSLNLF